MCCSPWGHKESDMTEQLNWTELIYYLVDFWLFHFWPWWIILLWILSTHLCDNICFQFFWVRLEWDFWVIFSSFILVLWLKSLSVRTFLGICKESVICSVVWHVLYCLLGLVGWNIVQVLCFLVHLVFSFSIHYWKYSIEMSSYRCLFFNSDSPSFCIQELHF